MDTTNTYTCYQCKKIYDSAWYVMLYNNNKFCSGFCIINYYKNIKSSNKFSSYDLSSLTDKIKNIKLQ